VYFPSFILVGFARDLSILSFKESAFCFVDSLYVLLLLFGWFFGVYFVDLALIFIIYLLLLVWV
jgi:hypothetical protein